MGTESGTSRPGATAGYKPNPAERRDMTRVWLVDRDVDSVVFSYSDVSDDARQARAGVAPHGYLVDVATSWSSAYSRIASRGNPRS